MTGFWLHTSPAIFVLVLFKAFFKIAFKLPFVAIILLLQYLFPHCTNAIILVFFVFMHCAASSYLEASCALVN